MSKSPDLRALVAKHGTPLLLVDCDVVRRQYRALHDALPDVTLHYALKPLPNAAVVAELRDLGACFDLATAGEIKLVRAAGVAPERCIHTHPIKSAAEIAAALRFGIRTFVADNPDELRKFVPSPPACRDPAAPVVPRPDGGGRPVAQVRLRARRGAAVTRAGAQPRRARAWPLVPRRLAGGRADASTSRPSACCAELIKVGARARSSRELDVVDIGGGFPMPYRGETEPIGHFCRPIRQALRSCRRRVRVIAEPGRFIAGPAGTAVARVMGRAQRDGRWWYYLDDGMYGSYSGQLYDHAHYPVEVPGRDGPAAPERAGRADLRQHRRDSRGHPAARARRSATSSSAA